MLGLSECCRTLRLDVLELGSLPLLAMLEVSLHCSQRHWRQSSGCLRSSARAGNMLSCCSHAEPPDRCTGSQKAWTWGHAARCSRTSHGASSKRRSASLMVEVGFGDDLVTLRDALLAELCRDFVRQSPTRTISGSCQGTAHVFKLGPSLQLWGVEAFCLTSTWLPCYSCKVGTFDKEPNWVVAVTPFDSRPLRFAQHPQISMQAASKAVTHSWRAQSSRRPDATRVAQCSLASVITDLANSGVSHPVTYSMWLVGLPSAVL